MCQIAGCSNVAMFGTPLCAPHRERLSEHAQVNLKRAWRAYSDDPMSKSKRREYEHRLDAARQELEAVTR